MKAYTPLPLGTRARDIVESLKAYRLYFGIPTADEIRRKVEKTDTRTVLPPSWVWK